MERMKEIHFISCDNNFILHFAPDTWIAPSNQITTWPGSNKDVASASLLPTCGFLLKFTAPSCPSVNFLKNQTGKSTLFIRLWQQRWNALSVFHFRPVTSGIRSCCPKRGINSRRGCQCSRLKTHHSIVYKEKKNVCQYRIVIELKKQSPHISCLSARGFKSH